MLKTALSIFGTILLIYCALLIATFMNQRNMMYFPARGLPDPMSAGLPDTETVSVETVDGLHLTGWFSRVEHPQGVIVYFHGNGGNISHRAERAAILNGLGYDVLLVGYRGYGLNPGRPTEAGLYNDARAYLNHLISSDHPAETVILYGESLGTGVAVQMALEYPQARALVLDAPYTSITDVAAELYPTFPVRLLLRDRYDSLSKIDKINMPLIVLHGGRDRVVPEKFGRRLFDRAPEPKLFLHFQNGAHYDLYEHMAGPRLAAALSQLKKSEGLSP